MAAFLRTLLSRIRGWMAMGRLDQEFQEELQSHMEMLTQENMDRGMAPEEAARDARLRLGEGTTLRETHREQRGLPFLDTLAQDVHFTLRLLRKNPGFTAIAILTLALGIGANTAIFSVINAVLLSPLPFPEPDQLVTFRSNQSMLEIVDVQEQNRVFSTGGGINVIDMVYTGGSEPMQIIGGYVDAGFFQVLGVPAALGRAIGPQEDRTGAPRSVVLTHAFWRDHFGSDTQVVGKSMRLNDSSYTIIGVMPHNFVLPEYTADIFVSLRVAYPEAAGFRGVQFLRSYWRLKPEITLARASAEIAAIDRRMEEQFPEFAKDRRTVLVPLQEWIIGDVRTSLLLLFGSVGLILLIACANFANLLLARSIARRREMVIRAALGGGRRRLIRQTLTESVMLALLGGIAGLLIARAGIALLMALKPVDIVLFSEITMDVRVLLFAMAVSVFTGILFGLIPAASASRTNVSEALQEQRRGATAGRSGARLRKILVISEMALAVVLVVAAALLVKGFTRLRSVDPGFDPAQVSTIRLQLPSLRYEDIPTQTTFRLRTLESLNAVPGMQAAMVSEVPLSGEELQHAVIIDGAAAVAPGDEPMVHVVSVMGDYFGVMRIPLLAGRALSPQDDPTAPPAAVINEAMAKRFFPEGNPIGKRLRWARAKGDPRWLTIAGVVGNIKQLSITQPAPPAVYIPYAQSDSPWKRWQSLVLRTSGSAAGTLDIAKREVWKVDNQIPVQEIRSMQAYVAHSFAKQKFHMFLFGLFAALALVLAATGIYGVMSYGVTERFQEIGVRMALGAQRGDVLRLVLRQGFQMMAIGIGAGVAGAYAVTRLMTSLLFSVSPTDPATFVFVTLLIAVVTLLACYVPARRALRVDPIVALRYE